MSTSGTGSFAHEDLPRIVNPPDGRIVTANQKIIGPEFPHLLSLDYAPGYRARRIYDRLSAMDTAGPEEAASVHAERVSVPATVYCRLLARAPGRGGRFDRARAMLTAWDCSMDRDRPEPTIYSAMRLSLNRRLAVHCLGELAGEAMDAAGRGIPAHLRQLEALFVAHAEAGDTSLLPEGLDWLTALGDGLEEGLTTFPAALATTWTAGPGARSTRQGPSTRSQRPTRNFRACSIRRPCRWAGTAIRRRRDSSTRQSRL